MKKALKWAGIGLGAILGIVVIVIIVSYFIADGKLNKEYDIAVTAVPTSQDSATLARGMHLATIFGCNHCHNGNLAGKVLIDAPPFKVVAANLTSGKGGVGATNTDEDWVRAIRHGVKANKRSAIIMPSAGYYHMSDEDLSAIISYVKSVPPVDNELPASELTLLGRVITTIAGMDLAAEYVDASVARKPAPPVGPTAEYGSYISTILCVDCHGVDLRGGENPDPAGPPVADLMPVAQWSTEQFSNALQRGMASDGHTMDPDQMPWSSFKAMTPEEVAALHAHLKAFFANAQQ
jgi:mono/diheme cytochrome c family protein